MGVTLHHPHGQLQASPFWPPCRNRDRPDDLAGTGPGGGMVAMNPLPESTAAALQTIVVNLEDA